MSRYVYSLVRCVPDPRTGEFVNIAAIAGQPESGDWSIRQVSNESRVRKLAGASEIASVHDFLARLGMRIDEQQMLLEVDAEEAVLNETWLARLHYDHRNVVQLTPPAPIVADDAEQALDVIFDRMIIDPISQARGFVTKHRVLSDVKEAYKKANIARHLVRSRVEVHVGDHIHAPVDFAIANGRAVQLAQAWSFQRSGVDEVATEVKAWGYALQRLRDGDSARVLGADERVSTIMKDVDIQVVIASPLTAKQRDVYDEARQVFGELNVSVNELKDADSVGVRASDLLDGS